MVGNAKAGIKAGSAVNGASVAMGNKKTGNAGLAHPMFKHIVNKAKKVEA